MIKGSGTVNVICQGGVDCGFDMLIACALYLILVIIFQCDCGSWTLRLNMSTNNVILFPTDLPVP